MITEKKNNVEEQEGNESGKDYDLQPGGLKPLIDSIVGNPKNKECVAGNGRVAEKFEKIKFGYN